MDSDKEYCIHSNMTVERKTKGVNDFPPIFPSMAVGYFKVLTNSGEMDRRVGGGGFVPPNVSFLIVIVGSPFA